MNMIRLCSKDRQTDPNELKFIL